MSMNRKILKTQIGVSLVELMVAGAILAGLAVVLMNLNQETVKSQKTAEVNFNMNQLWINIQSSISMRQNCSLNFAGFNPTRDEAAFALASESPAPEYAFLNPPVPFPDNALWRTVVNQNHQQIIRVGETFNNEFRITGISTERNGNDEFNLRIRAEKLKEVHGAREITRNFRIQAVIADPNNTPGDLTDDSVVSCFTDDSAIIEAALEEVCNGGGGGIPAGIWDQASSTCRFFSLSGTCASGEFVQSYVMDSLNPWLMIPSCVDVPRPASAETYDSALHWKSNTLHLDAAGDCPSKKITLIQNKQTGRLSIGCEP
jgi:hypothetical protein